MPFGPFGYGGHFGDFANRAVAPRLLARRFSSLARPMSNFLFLVNRLKQETGVAGPALTDIVFDHGTEEARLVQWVKNSYSEICAQDDDWRFLRSSFTLDTQADVNAYGMFDATDTELSITVEEWEFNKWLTNTFLMYRASSGVSTSMELPFVSYPTFRDTYLARPMPSSQPNCFTIRPSDSAILLGPTPNAVFTVRGDYQRTAAQFADKLDEPIFGPQFAEIVVWYAIHKYMAYEEDPGGWDNARRQYLKMLGPFQRKYLPIAWIGG